MMQRVPQIVFREPVGRDVLSEKKGLSLISECNPEAEGKPDQEPAQEDEIFLQYEGSLSLRHSLSVCAIVCCDTMAHKRRCRRRVFPANKCVAGAVDCMVRSFGSSAHSLLQLVGIEPDDVLLQLCVHLYQNLNRWGLLSDLSQWDEPMPVSSMTHCLPTAASHCDFDLQTAKCIHVTATPVTGEREDELISLTSGSSISLLSRPDQYFQQPLFSLSDFTDFSGMSDSKCGAVDFKNIREHYVSDADIVCRFEYTNCEHQAGDVVAIKKISWKMDELHMSLVTVSASDAVVDDPSGKIMRIVFPRSLFAGLTAWPDDDLFQFCYISGSVLQGVSSISFSIIRPKESDYADFSRDSDGNDDDGFVVLRSPQALLQEKMEKLQTDLTAAEAEKILTDIRNKSLHEEMSLLRDKVGQMEEEKVIVQRQTDSLTSELETLRMTNQRLELTATEANASHTETVSAITLALSQEKKQHQGVLLALQETCDELTRVRAENAELRKSLNDWTRRRREEEEQLTEANDLMIKVLKEEVQKLEHKTSLAYAERDFANDSLQAAQKSVEQMQRDAAESKAQVAELKRSAEQAKNTAEEYKLRLDKAKVEYEERYKYGVKLEGKLQRMREKVNLIRPISRSTSTCEPVPETIPKESFPVANASGGEDCGADVYSQTSCTDPSHDRLVCPICDRSFSKKVAGIESHFHGHVESHFASGVTGAESAGAAAAIADHRAVESDKPAPACRNCARDADSGRHGQLICPICSREFCKKIPGIDSYFHCHVESHFDPRHYPTDA